MQIGFFDGDYKLKINKPIRLVELFAGIGAQAAALRNIGANFKHFRICEYDKFAVQSYNAIHGTDFQPSDITKINALDLIDLKDADRQYCYLWTYSFPCTDLSTAGKGLGMERGSGTRSGLLWEVERLLIGTSEYGKLPEVLLMENVPQVLTSDGWGEWFTFLEKIGYKSHFEILNAKDFGIPQNRERAFMVSMLDNYYYAFPKKQVLTKRISDLLEHEPVAQKYYLTNKQVASSVKSTYGTRQNEIVDAGGGINENALRSRSNDADLLKTVRSGGRGSLDRHMWDILEVINEY